MNLDKHDDLLKTLDALNQDVPPMPEGFHEGWVSRLEDDMNSGKQKKISRQTLIRVLSAAAALVFVVGGATLARQNQEERVVNQVAGAGQVKMSRNYDSAANDMAMPMTMAMPEVMEEAFEDAEYETGSTADAGVFTSAAAKSMAEAPSEQMIIRTASLTIGTQTYDESLAALRSLCGEAGGWSSSVSENTNNSGLRTCYLTLRVPSGKLDGFLSGTADLGRVTYRSEHAEDVTESYRDTQGRLNTQLALMARLQALVTDAADLSDLLALESQIADTQYQIDRLQTSLNGTERKVNYATVDVTLREESPAADITDGEKTLGQRIVSALKSGGAAFVELLENAAVWVAAALPFIGIVAAVWAAVALIRRRVKRRKAE